MTRRHELIVFLAVLLATGCSSPTFALAKEVKLADVIKIADQIRLDAVLGTPSVLAGQRSKTYMKVGLEGLARSEPSSRAPVNIALVLDRSSSMSGKKIIEAKQAAAMALGRLAPQDIVSVVCYDSTVEVVVEATAVSNKESIAAAIEQIEPRGSTALFAGVSVGAAELRKYFDRNRVNRIILLSDGMANIGPSSPGELADLGRSLAKEGISVTTIGLGLGYNEDLMMQLALASDGNHAFVEEPSELAKIFNYEFGDVLSVVAQDIAVQVKLAKGVTPVRVLGRDAVIDGQTVTTRLNQVYAGHEKYLLLEVAVPPTAPGARRNIANVDVAYDNMASKKRDHVRDQVTLRATTSPAQVDRDTIKEVMIAATEMLATEQSRLAVALRDDGKVEEAKKVLLENEKFLQRQDKKLNSPKLKRLKKLNQQSADQLEAPDWNRSRKQMRDYQFEAENQMTY